ncbi:TetR/AcrR family transcriptional regulator [Modestobacter sp. I12A-02662]|uniref:TetR/AcrR family transcriptional regulator n=1 Tax=Modestobacter sp. I12A-02662 TaxID=1730496 RepID=UPI0034DEDE8D
MVATRRSGAGAAARSSRPDEVVGRDKVLRTALQLFLQHGYAGTSMKAIANDLGVSAPALYWYFPSKEEIFASVIEMAVADFWSSVRDSLTDEDPVGRLGQLVRAHVSWQLNQSDVARTFDVNMTMRQLASELPEDRARAIVAIEREYVDELRSILAEGDRRGLFRFDDLKVTAFAITTVCEYVHTWFNPAGSLTVDGVAAHYEALVLQMVGARPGVDG